MRKELSSQKQRQTCSHFMVMASATLTVLLLLPLLPLATFSQSQSNITLGSSLTADSQNSSWKSPSGDFAFGFQEVQGGGFLLAIWFDKIPEKTVIWWANADKLAPNGSKVVLTEEGSFVLNDPTGKQTWSPLTGAGVSFASMLDTGNFVLADETGSSLWESFSQPTDTIVPTQVLAQEAKLVSRYSDTNYSTGRFELRMQSGNLVMSNSPFTDADKTPSYWSSGTVSGYQLVFNRTGKIYLTNQSGSVLREIMSSLVSEDLYQRVVLEYDGVFRQYTYPRNASLGSGSVMGWSPTSSPVPGNICTRVSQSIGVGVCGVNSYCTLEGNQKPRCNCPPRYSHIDPSYPMDGCKPDFLLQSCDEGTLETDSFEMRELSNTNWPLNDYAAIVNQNAQSCRQACLSDCFCHFAIFGRSNTCWKKRMPVSNGALNPSSNSATMAYVKVRTDNSTSNIPPCDPKKKDKGPLIIQQRNRPLIILGLSSSAALNLVLLLLTFLIWFHYNRKQKVVNSSQPCLISRFSSLRSFTYKELTEATDGFKEELGRGAFGSVYKGVLKSNDRSLIAVKVLDKLTTDGDGEFNTEVDIIGQTNHRNLVKLIGFCDEGQNRLLVYDFMPNGSLAGFLFKGSRPSWFKRIEIASGVARGLLYLHEECSKQIIHCDIKPQNILLDESLTAKISDFGLAKLLMLGQTRTMTAIRGTKGYLAPEWFRNKPISFKVDVYSFGILLLELVCCRKSCELELNDETQMILSDWVYDCYREGRLNLIGEGDEEMLGDMKRMRRVVMIALWCIQEDPSLRPSMKNISQMLEGVVEVSIPPGPSSSINLS